jgi:hypothetical protein
MMNSLLIILCIHGMKLFFLIGKAMGLVMGGLLILSGLSLYRTSIPRQMFEDYSWSMRVHLSLPFSSRWSNEVAPEHVAIIRKFRRALFSMELVLFVFGVWVVAYDNLLGARLLFMMAGGQCGQ